MLLPLLLVMLPPLLFLVILNQPSTGSPFSKVAVVIMTFPIISETAWSLSLISKVSSLAKWQTSTLKYQRDYSTQTLLNLNLPWKCLFSKSLQRKPTILREPSQISFSPFVLICEPPQHLFWGFMSTKPKNQFWEGSRRIVGSRWTQNKCWGGSRRIVGLRCTSEVVLRGFA